VRDPQNGSISVAGGEDSHGFSIVAHREDSKVPGNPWNQGLDATNVNGDDEARERVAQRRGDGVSRAWRTRVRRHVRPSNGALALATVYACEVNCRGGDRCSRVQHA
jgi:hypothetical protein